MVNNGLSSCRTTHCPDVFLLVFTKSESESSPVLYIQFNLMVNHG